MIRYFPFYRQRVTVPRFLVPCILFLAAMVCEFGRGVVLDRQREEKGDLFSGVVRGLERGVDSFLPHILGGWDWFDHCWCPLPL